MNLRNKHKNMAKEVKRLSDTQLYEFISKMCQNYADDVKMAIEVLKFHKPIGAINAGFKEEISEDVKAFNMAISALEKQIPKKPKKQPYMQEKFDSGTEYLCPNCELLVGGYSDDLEDWCGQHDYCEDCGQKIDWEVEHEHTR